MPENTTCVCIHAKHVARNDYYKHPAVRTCANLQITPLLAQATGTADYLTLADAYEHFSGSVDEYVAAFKTSDTQVGACFSINGTIRGVELFDVSATCSKLMPKLIRSYALDAIEERPVIAWCTCVHSARRSIIPMVRAVLIRAIARIILTGTG